MTVKGLTDDQQVRASAWEQVFTDSASAQIVLDDMTAFTNTLPETQTAGACKLLLYILAKRGQLRRATAKARGLAK